MRTSQWRRLVAAVVIEARGAEVVDDVEAIKVGRVDEEEERLESVAAEDDGDEASLSPASTSSSNSSSSTNINPLYELSDQLMAQLPIKRGLSRFYHGKSQSSTSLLGSVNSLEDLVKKMPSGRILKMTSKCKSLCWVLERQKHCYGPKPAISKKAS